MKWQTLECADLSPLGLRRLNAALLCLHASKTPATGRRRP